MQTRKTAVVAWKEEEQVSVKIPKLKASDQRCNEQVWISQSSYVSGSNAQAMTNPYLLSIMGSCMMQKFL